MAVISTLKTYRDLTQSTFQRRQTIAYLAAATLGEKLDRLADLGKSLATRVQFRKLLAKGDWEGAIAILDEVPSAFPVVHRIFLADPSGTLRVDTPQLAGVRGKNFADRDWYRGVKSFRSPYISEVYKRSASPRLNVFAVAVPVMAPGQNDSPLAILVLQIKVESLFDWSPQIDLGPSGFLYFVDQRGRLAAHPRFDLEKDLIDFSEVPTVKNALQGKKGVEVVYNPIEKEERLSAYEPVPRHGWAVIAQQPTSEAFSVRRETLLTMSAVYALILLLTGGLGLFIVRTMNRLEDARRQAGHLNTQLVAANRELEAFSYSVSHDLRAPLRSMMGFSQALLEDHGTLLDEKGKDYLQRISLAAAKMGQLIDGLLELSRLGRRELRGTRVDLSRIAEEICEQLVRENPGRRAAVSIAPGLIAEGDGEMLRALMENLLRNAFKFTARQPEASIEFGMRTENTGERVYYVRDNGAGFDMAYVSKLFGAFQRLHSSSEFEGTGIGLATAKRIVHRHGGRIWADGSVNQGATISFTLSRENGR